MVATLLPTLATANSRILTAIDVCTATRNALLPGYSMGPLALGSTEANVSLPTGLPRIAVDDNYSYVLSLQAGGTVFNFPGQTCSVEKTYEIANTPDGPGAGDVLDNEDVSSGDLTDWLGDLFRDASYALTKDATPATCDTSTNCGISYTGVRGSVDTGGGLSLNEASPAYVIFQPAAPLSGTLGIPFAVTAAGDGDWLSLYLGPTLFFKQPLANFEPGLVYFALLTVPTDRVSNAPLTFWLDSTGASGAAVFFPTAITAVPLPTSLALLACALPLLARHRRAGLTPARTRCPAQGTIT